MMRYTTEFYLILAGILALGSIIVALLSRYIKYFSRYKKNALLYLCGMALVFTVISTVPFFFTHRSLMKQYFFCEMWFLSLGILHVHLMYTRFWANENTLASELLFILIIWLFGGAGFVLMNRWLDRDTFLYYPMLTSMFSFVLPTFVYKTFERMMAIPVKLQQWWQYPMYKEIPEVNEEEMRDLIVIGLEMEKAPKDKSRTYFRARTPIKMDLGDLFYHFINDYNDRYPDMPIDFVDSTGQPYGWVFHLKPRWFGSAKMLDPQKAVFMNGIKENSVIICNRIMLS
ncbi:TssN family type VI secretion system protein [Chitinophaga sp. 30R24]|uniref:TssN family type VI secretion system protein n=1 Tax=Chitinophaga sp. 30R24 TaxID=3248838 RepID=UPI003B91515A